MISKSFNSIEKQARRLRDFFKLESAGGIVLILSAALAMIMANTGAASFYDHLLHANVGIFFGEFQFSKHLLHWINDGLMAIFFFLVGLEIKRELLGGQLSSKENAMLPALAAVGGMAMPALVYFLVNRDHPELLHGWAIPSATDIAFALGILSLLGKRAPVSLKVLLTAIAVIDDLGAVIIIALFYTDHLSLQALGAAAVCITILVIMNRMGVARAAAYIIIGVILWVAVLKSGVHATLAGVITALLIPHRIKPRANSKKAPPNLIEQLEHALHPWVAFMIMPVFAFANAGVSLAGVSFKDLLEPLPLGIMLGLIVGKQSGIFLTIWATVKSGLCPMPKNTTWYQLYALSALCGIGFTMSLFIGTLAFRDPALAAPVRLGVLSGSIVSAIFGYLLIRLTCKNKT
ncbi:MAG: Na+/H+ antiporter NhaA [Bdellovibrionales bacterium]|jgi:NhaA family Na+:H+ antiporter|nr:Na+/H+ antiporter NhaA [Bdellovibrionales bacterium]